MWCAEAKRLTDVEGKVGFKVCKSWIDDENLEGESVTGGDGVTYTCAVSPQNSMRKRRESTFRRGEVPKRGNRR